MAHRDVIRISLLYSTTGAYAPLGRDAIDGAMAAIAEVNSNEHSALRLEPVIADPGGIAERYAAMAEDAIRNRGCRHVIGTITSWARKEVLPVVERHRSLLWYAFPHEGYEASDHTLYLGACPNQHLLPLFAHVLPRFGGHPMVVGSDYIWGWEVGRIARELVEAVDGAVLAERNVPLGETDFGHLIAEIRARRPDFVLSNLVGESLSAFLAAYGALGRETADFRADIRPVVSCNSTEIDLKGLGAAASGHITTSVYFDQLATPENIAFKKRMHKRMGRDSFSAPFIAGYSAVSMLAAAIVEAGSDAPEAIRELVTARRYDTPLGPVTVDTRTHHAALRPHLGRATADGAFEIIESAPAPIVADPFLVASQLDVVPFRRGGETGHLQLVSSREAAQ